MKILLDAMGGDNAPDANIKGAVKAINQIEAEVVLIGNEEVINNRVKALYGKNNISEISNRLTIHHTTETIDMEDFPTVAIKHKLYPTPYPKFKCWSSTVQCDYTQRWDS